MKLLAVSSSFFVPLADAAVLRLRGNGGNHTQIEHHTHHTKNPGCDGACAFYPDMCTYDFSGNGMNLDCSGCSACQTAAVSQTPPSQGVKIRYQTGRYSGSQLGDDVQAFVNAVRGSQPGQGYCEADLTEASWKNRDNCAEGQTEGQMRDIAFHVTVEFDNYIGSNWNFNFGVDFGWGGAIYMDGHLMRAYSGDIWWSESEDHANELGFGTFVPAGRHNLTVYGAEGCCDGPSRIKFCANCEEPRNMEVLSVANIEKAVDHFMEFGSFDEVNKFHAFTAEFETPPVVVIKGGSSSQIHVIDVTETGFSTKGSSADKKLEYLAVEPGAHLLPDGRTISAGTTTWASPYNDGKIMSLGHDFGPYSLPAFEVTWVGTPLESIIAPGVSSQLSPTEASLSKQGQPAPAGPAQEWRPDVDLSVVQRGAETLGYVAMGRGIGSFRAKGGKTVTYGTMGSLFNFTEPSFVV